MPAVVQTLTCVTLPCPCINITTDTRVSMHFTSMVLDVLINAEIYNLQAYICNSNLPKLNYTTADFSNEFFFIVNFLESSKKSPYDCIRCNSPF